MSCFISFHSLAESGSWNPDLYFTDGLNPWLLGKHAYGLQFVFPAYIWTITAFIVVTSQLLVILSRFLGMVLLLSYTKILCPLHHISTLLWWSIARIVVCPYAGNTQYTFHLHTSLSSEYNCHWVSMPPIHTVVLFSYSAFIQKHII